MPSGRCHKWDRSSRHKQMKRRNSLPFFSSPSFLINSSSLFRNIIIIKFACDPSLFFFGNFICFFCCRCSHYGKEIKTLFSILLSHLNHSVSKLISKMRKWKKTERNKLFFSFENNSYIWCGWRSSGSNWRAIHSILSLNVWACVYACNSFNRPGTGAHEKWL